jgi:hypothetical protein
MKTKLFLTGLALIALTSISAGQKSETDSKQVTTPDRGVYVDENKNGVCDNYENRKDNRPGQGRFCYRGGSGRGEGRGYCYRGGNGPGQGRGQGRLYVDKDNNGVCDNFEARSKKE